MLAFSYQIWATPQNLDLMRILRILKEVSTPTFIWFRLVFWYLKSKSSSLLFFIFFGFLGPHLWYMEVPRLGVESELQLPADTTATAIQDQSPVWNLHHNSWQCQIFNPLSEARDWTRNLMVRSQICFHCATMGTPWLYILLKFLISLTHSIEIQQLTTNSLF